MNWNFKLIYENEQAYENDVQKIKEMLTCVPKYQGKLHDSKVLKEFLEFTDELSLIFEKVFSYTSMHYDLNQKDVNSLNKLQMVYAIYNEFASMLSFVDSELIAIGHEKLNEMLENDDDLKKYEFMVRKLFAGEKHVLSSREELLLSYFNAPLSDYNSMYDQLATSDYEGEEVTFSNGETHVVTTANFHNFLTLPNQEDRQKAFEAVYKYYDKHKNTFAAIYKGIIDSDIASMKARNYDNILSSFLEHNQIPNDVFLNLVKICKTENKSLKKYYQMRKDFFKLDTLHTYDRFLEMSNYSKKYTYEEAKDLFYEAVKQIGGEFEERAHRVTAPGRVDVNIKDGKRTGAYSTGFYKEGPFILLNHNGSLDDCFTLAHEAGHSMHTTYANESQPACTANYVIFVAEVASTFNEQLLLDYLVKNSLDKDLKISILQKAIDGLISTFYRQALFGDFEYQAHNLVLEGKSVTCESLSEIMRNLYHEYYGYDLTKEAYKELVWAYIPHLYHTPFYVYQYATSFASSLAIYDMVKNKVPNAYENYLNLLRAGGSNYPVKLLQNAGVDLTTTKPFEAVIKRLDFLVSELEKALNE